MVTSNLQNRFLKWLLNKCHKDLRVFCNFAIREMGDIFCTEPDTFPLISCNCLANTSEWAASTWIVASRLHHWHPTIPTIQPVTLRYRSIEPVGSWDPRKERIHTKVRVEQDRARILICTILIHFMSIQSDGSKTWRSLYSFTTPQVSSYAFYAWKFRSSNCELKIWNYLQLISLWTISEIP